MIVMCACCIVMHTMLTTKISCVVDDYYSMPNSGGSNNNQTPDVYPDYDMAEQVHASDGIYHLADDTRGDNSEYTLAGEVNPKNGVQNEDGYQLADSSTECYANFDSIQR